MRRGYSTSINNEEDLSYRVNTVFRINCLITKQITLLWLFLFSTILSAFTQSVVYKVHKDGSFDILGTSVKIKDCYPAIDDILLKPVAVKITQTKKNQQLIEYSLVDRKVYITIGYEEDALAINTSVSGEDFFPFAVAPIQSAYVEGANRIYRTPTQIMGSGGIKNWPSDNSKYTSCGNLTGLIPDKGSTMVISTRDFSKFVSYTNCYPTKLNAGKKLIDVLISTEKVAVKSLPAVYITENASAFEAMKNEASKIAEAANVKNDKPQSYHWCSWYYSYYYLTDKMLEDYLKGFQSIQPKVPIQTIQIDAGYFPHAGDWLEPGDKFPNGIENSIKEIIKHNYKAGIWIGPYMVGNRSKLYKEHPDWILHKKDGSTVINMQMYGENRLWGAMDEEIYTLDTSNPEVMEYLRQVFRRFRKMGITFFKTDFMLYGSESSADVKRYAPGKTSVEYQHDLFKMIRQEIGRDSYWLGCIAPFAPMIGYVDGMRISADIAADWEHSENMFNETIGCQHINNVWWQNDPDAIILREKYSNLTDEETQSMALWMGMLGGVINTSDLFYEIPKNRLELFRFLEPSPSKLTSSMPFIDKENNFLIQVRKYPKENTWAILFVNRNNEKKTGDFSLHDLAGIEKGTCFDWASEGLTKMGVKESLHIDLDGHNNKLIFITSDGNSPEHLSLGGVKIKN